jgi:hypothetical protein
MAMKKNASARRKARVTKAHEKKVQHLTTHICELQYELIKEQRARRVRREWVPPPEATGDYGERVFKEMAVELGQLLAKEIHATNPSMHAGVLRRICVEAYDVFMNEGRYGSLTTFTAYMYEDIVDAAVEYAMELVPNKVAQFHYKVPRDEFQVIRAYDTQRAPSAEPFEIAVAH